MAEVVAAALTSHAPLITGKPDIARPEQRERLYAGFRELGRRLAAARPELIVMFVNDHLQNFPYSNLPAFCVGLAEQYDAPSAGGGKFMRIPPRKLRGGYYTDPVVAAFLACWVHEAAPRRVLEPACGDGVFFDAFRQLDRNGKTALFGCEIDAEAAATARRHRQRLTLNPWADPPWRCRRCVTRPPMWPRI